MPRYLIERTFQEKVDLPGIEQQGSDSQTFIENNSLDGVTWVQSYIVPGKKKSYCIYDAPNPEAVRRAALRNGIPVDRMIEVHLLAPYMFTSDDE